MTAAGKGEDEVKTFKKSITDNLVPMLKNFKELDFYIGEGMDTSNGMILILDYKEYKGEERPYFIAFKHGLEEKGEVGMPAGFTRTEYYLDWIKSETGMP